MGISYKGRFVFSYPSSVGRSIWIRSFGVRSWCRRATASLGIDRLIANILVVHNFVPFYGRPMK